MFAHIPDQPSVIPDVIGDPCGPGFSDGAGNDEPWRKWRPPAGFLGPGLHRPHGLPQAPSHFAGRPAGCRLGVGIGVGGEKAWIPACAGMTEGRHGFPPARE